MTDYEMMVAMLEKTVTRQEYSIEVVGFGGAKFIDITPQGTKNCVSFMFDETGNFMGFENIG